jgi:SSS family solute:Na+ symporter
MPYQIYLPILIYFAFTLSVGLMLKEKASESTNDFFLGGGDMPWFLTGLSIVATTFAADTPLAITGIIAGKGLSGNWIWLSVVVAHAAVIAFFSCYWNRAKTITDSELITLRYSGKPAGFLRLLRAGLGGILINCIIMGWVIRAMVKISSEFFDWQKMAPWLYDLVSVFWPSTFGSPSEGVTILVLILLVVVYSTMGGIRGVIYTDMLQFALAFGGSTMLAWSLWDEVGGRSGIQTSLAELYGPNHTYLNLFPNGATWLSELDIGFGVFGIYLFVQSFSRPDVDGGGYMMQRLNATKGDDGARKAAATFVLFHYLIRLWPWLIVGVAALILIPLGHEHSVFSGEAVHIASDREAAYPFLMKHFLSPWAMGFLLTSFLAAFMSTMDTHLNWGASYIVNDWIPRLVGELEIKKQVLAARCSVAGFGVLGILVSFQIDTIEKAWQVLAAIGAALGLPTLLRWLWWRVTAWSELLSVLFGLTTYGIVLLTDQPYEWGIILITGGSAVGVLIGAYLLPPTDPNVIQSFYDKVQPKGVWPQGSRFPGIELVIIVVVSAIVVGGLQLGVTLLFG